MQVIFRCDPALIDVLPKPQPARTALPDWLRALAPRRHSELHGRDIRTIKQCPPFVDAMAHGFVVLLPCDVHASGDGELAWDWDLPAGTVRNHPRSPISFHVEEQLDDTPLARGHVAIKFNSFWTIALPPGWSLFATHPVNREDLPFRTLTGLVDAGRFHEVGINFPALWLDETFKGTVPRGTPVAQCFPVPRDGLALVCEPMDEAAAERFATLAEQVLSEPGVYRRLFRVKPRA